MPIIKVPETCHMLVVAAGKGMRVGGPVPKQYQKIAGTALLRRTVDALMQTFPPDQIHCVIAEPDQALFAEAVNGLDIAEPIIGGASRQETVLKGLLQLETLGGVETVMIHDGARPFLSQDLIISLLDCLEDGATGVIPGLAVTDTIKRVAENRVSGTVDRDTLRAVQTPQAFDFSAILAAHKAAAGQVLTDDASVLEEAGGEVKLINGDARNIKITHPEDFLMAERSLMETCPDIRVGSGFDVHRFEAGDHVTLGGIEIPHSAKLKGHSDADVALHALTDAILAALSDGDIGTHFPPSEPKWKGAPSDLFLEFAADRVRARGGMIAHLGVVLMCEAPKIGPHRPAMTARIAEIAGIDVSRVSVQATTTEKLGFTGRSEGIAAQGTATIRLPLEMQDEN